MAYPHSATRGDDPSTITSVTPSYNAGEKPALEQASEATSNTPTLKSKPLDADKIYSWKKTGLAKKLEESYINQSATSTLFNLDQTTAKTEGVLATPCKLEDIETADRIVCKRKLEKEYPSHQRCLVSKSHSDSPRSPYRPPPTGMVTIHPLKKTTDDSIELPEHASTPTSQRKALISSMRPLARLKEKVENFLSPEPRTNQLMQGIEWTSFSDSLAPDATDSLNRFTDETNSPPRSPRVGEKRKVTDEMNPGARPKRLRFSEDDLSRASESPIEQTHKKFKPFPEHEKEIDRLSKELAKDYEPNYGFISKKYETAGIATEQKKCDTNPMDFGNLGESVRSARAKNTIWFTTNIDQSASISAQTTLKLLLDANEKKINKPACNSLQELFALIPAGAIFGTEFFDQALRRAVSELSLSAKQWSDIDDLYGQYNQLHLLSNPHRSVGFKELLGRIITIKNSMLEGESLSPTS